MRISGKYIPSGIPTTTFYINSQSMIVFLWIVFVLLLISIVLFWLILKAFKNPVRQHDKTPEDIGIPFKEISIATKNNCSLYGWWIPGKEKAPLLILVHGWGRNVGRMMPYIEKLHKAGFNLIAFDSRNHGSSDADQHSTMLKFAEDIHSTIEYATENEWTKKPSIISKMIVKRKNQSII